VTRPGRPKIDRDGSGVCGGPGDRTSESPQEQKRFFYLVVLGNVDPNNQIVKAAVEVPKLYFVALLRVRGADGKTLDFPVLCSIPIHSRSRISVIKSRSSSPAQYHRAGGNEAATRRESGVGVLQSRGI